MTAAVAPLSTGDLIRAVTPGLALDLASSASVKRLIAAGDRLPLTTGGGFECHLGNPDRVDLAVRFLTGENGTASLLQGTDVDLTIDPGVLGLVREWLQTTERATYQPLNFWLEYDLDSDKLPRSSIFLGPGNSLRNQPERLDLETYARMVQSLVPAQHGIHLASALQEIYEALPTNSWIGYVGRMASDATGQVRLTVSGILPEQITALLRRIGWSEADTTGAAQIARTSGAHITLSFDLGRDREAKLGLELALASNADWKTMLARVLPVGDCDLSLIPALLAWSGVTCCGDEHWPAALRPAVWGIARRINHLKIVYRGTEPPQVKAYLYYGVVEKS